MRKLTTGEVNRMIGSQDESLNDTCAEYSVAFTTDSDTGEQIAGYTQLRDYNDSTSTSIPCGFVETNAFRNERGQLITIDADAILRLHYKQPVGVGYKVVTHDKNFIVDGVTTGRHVMIAALKEIVP